MGHFLTQIRGHILTWKSCFVVFFFELGTLCRSWFAVDYVSLSWLPCEYLRHLSDMSDVREVSRRSRVNRVNRARSALWVIDVIWGALLVTVVSVSVVTAWRGRWCKLFESSHWFLPGQFFECLWYHWCESHSVAGCFSHCCRKSCVSCVGRPAIELKEVMFVMPMRLKTHVISREACQLCHSCFLCDLWQCSEFLGVSGTSAILFCSVVHC